MTKLENTTKNKLLVLSGTVIGLGFIGFSLGKNPSDRRTLAGILAVVGLLVSQGIMSWIIKPKIVK